jgi:type IV fimbrial biogenesis protein FimT
MVTRMDSWPSNRSPRTGYTRQRIAGVTLLEVLTVMTIVCILMALGVPSYQYITNANRISGEVNDLLGDMQYARSEAIKEGQTVSVCASANPTATTPTCSGTITWQTGWIVFSDVNGDGSFAAPDTLLRAKSAFPVGDTFDANNGMSTVIFNREGFALGLNNTVTVTLHAAVPNSQTTRCLQLTIIGQLMTETAGTNNCS